MPIFSLGNSQLNDLYDKVRVSTPFTLFNCQFLFDKKPLFWDELLLTGGTSTFSVNTSDVSMTVTTSSGSKVVRQTKEYFIYQANRAHQFSGTVIFGTAQSNTNQYVGLLDDNDGVAFTLQGTVFGVVTRTSTSGVPVDTFVPSTSFNIDKLDGTGPSGVAIDLTKTQLLYIEYQWFGVGSVRWGVYFNGHIFYVHQIDHTNAVNVVYMKRGNLPVRYEIVNIGVTEGTCTMNQICCNVDSEGGYSPLGIKRAADLNTATVIVGPTLIPLLSINLKTAAICGTIIPESFTFLGTTADSYEYKIIFNGTLTGASYSSVDSTSIAQFDITATAISGGTIISAGYASSVQRVILEQAVASTLKLASSINGITDTITLAACHVGNGTVPMLAAIEWKEFI